MWLKKYCFKIVDEIFALNVLLISLLLSGCSLNREVIAVDAIGNINTVNDSGLKQQLSNILVKHRVNTLGVAIIKDGKLNWSKQYGEQAPGIPVSFSTLFDVGSITKTVTTEAVLRLVEEGKISLDESMAKYWVDPDLKDDPRIYLLTPRMVLSHTTGFPNWRFFSSDRKLKFLNDPGTKYGYSGEGFQYLARFIEKKLGVPFKDVIQSTIFEPLTIKNVSISVDSQKFSSIAQQRNESGEFPGYYCRPNGWCANQEGSTSAAGGMVISLNDYATFLLSTMRGEGISHELMNLRETIIGTIDDLDCQSNPKLLCPIQLGYGLGWNINEFEKDKTIGHRGTDWSVVTLAYYYKNSRNGLIIFINAPNKAGMSAMVDLLEILDPTSAELHGYRARRDRD